MRNTEYMVKCGMVPQGAERLAGMGRVYTLSLGSIVENFTYLKVPWLDVKLELWFRSKRCVDFYLIIVVLRKDFELETRKMVLSDYYIEFRKLGLLCVFRSLF